MQADHRNINEAFWCQKEAKSPERVAQLLERVAGIEPTRSAWEADKAHAPPAEWSRSCRSTPEFAIRSQILGGLRSRRKH